MTGDRRSYDTPILNGSLGEDIRAEISAAFLRSAETGNRPWASIGIDDWLQAGKWWLLKVPDKLMITRTGRLTLKTDRLGPKSTTWPKDLGMKFMPISTCSRHAGY